MDNTGFLVDCPNCAREGKKQVLGRITPSGDLVVLRFHHGTTLIKAQEYQLVCGCGYTMDIQGTIIQSATAILL